MILVAGQCAPFFIDRGDDITFDPHRILHIAEYGARLRRNRHQLCNRFAVFGNHHGLSGSSDLIHQFEALGLENCCGDIHWFSQMTTICGHYIRSKNRRNYSWTTESDLCVRGKLLNYLLAGLRSERNTRPHKAKPASAKIPSKLNDPPPPLPGGGAVTFTDTVTTFEVVPRLSCTMY